MTSAGDFPSLKIKTKTKFSGDLHAHVLCERDSACKIIPLLLNPQVSVAVINFITLLQM